MADFFQNGVITTLSNIGNRPLEALEEELRTFSQRRNMVLLLPALYSEFETPAMHRIIEELKGVDYLYKIVLGLTHVYFRFLYLGLGGYSLFIK